MSENKIRVFGGSDDVAAAAGIDFEFGRSIGATHYVEESCSYCFLWLKIENGIFYRHGFGAWEKWEKWLNVNDREALEIPPLTEWSIHNNDKPLNQLSDEQYGKMRRAEDDGGVVELFHGNAWVIAKFCLWDKEFTYRIRPKSERDTFVEQCVNLMTSETERFQEQMFAEVFDAIQRGDIKAPEVSK